MAHRVEYLVAKSKFEIWKKKAQCRRYLDEKDLGEKIEDVRQFLEKQNAELFVSQEETVEQNVMQVLGAYLQPQSSQSTAQPEGPVLTRAPVKRKRPNRISAAEKRKSMEVGFEPILEKLQGKNRRKDKSPTSRAEEGEKSEPKPQRKRTKRGKKSEQAAPLNLSSNVIQEAHISSAMPALKGITGKKRQDVMAQIIASIPAENQEEAEDDGRMINKATKKFSHRLMGDDLGNWKMKGMETSIYNYQVSIEFNSY